MRNCNCSPHLLFRINYSMAPVEKNAALKRKEETLPLYQYVYRCLRCMKDH